MDRFLWQNDLEFRKIAGIASFDQSHPVAIGSDHSDKRWRHLEENSIQYPAIFIVADSIDRFSSQGIKEIPRDIDERAFADFG